MENLKKWLKSVDDNKFITYWNHITPIMTAYPKVNSEFNENICDELNDFLLELKEGWLGSNFFIEFRKWINENDYPDMPMVKKVQMFANKFNKKV